MLDWPLCLATETLHQDFVTILVFMLFGAVFVVLNMVAIGRLIRSKTKYTEGKSASYECGEPTFGSAFVRFDIRFYVLALVFVIFDVEVLFLFPWAAVMKDLGILAWGEAAVFVLVLAVVTCVFVALMIHSRVGRVLVSIRENEVLAETLGVNAFKYRMIAFAIGGLWATYILYRPNQTLIPENRPPHPADEGKAEIGIVDQRLFGR